MTEKQLKYHKLYLDLAKRISEMSYAERLKVGAVLVKDGNIISFGWNGSLQGRPNECEYLGLDGESVTKPEIVHAEENCIVKAARNGVSTKGSVIYITHFPCIRCTKMIINAGIKMIVYCDEYNNSNEVVDMLLCCKVGTLKI